MEPAELCRIWDEYQPRLLLIARACAGGLWGRGEELAEDAVQEAFIELTAQPIVPRDPLGWLVRVARNRLIDWQRSDQRRQQRELARRQVSENVSWFVATDCGDASDLESVQIGFRLPPQHGLDFSVQAVDEAAAGRIQTITKAAIKSASPYLDRVTIESNGPAIRISISSEDLEALISQGIGIAIASQR